MRINLVSSVLDFPTNSASWQWLTKLLAERAVLIASIKRVTPRSVFVQIEQREVELPLPTLDTEQQLSFSPGKLVEISKQDDQTISIRLSQSVGHSQSKQQALISSQLEQVLIELNISPTAESVLVAQSLLEYDFPLQKNLFWALIPWAESGYLEEALQLLQAKFSLRPEWLEMLQQFENKDLGEVVLPQVRESLPDELQKMFRLPQWENRSKWSRVLAEGDVVKGLVRLLVKERLIESILDQRSTAKEHVFFLPYLLNEDLYAGRVRITREEEYSTKGDEGSLDNFRLELKIPTINLGLVGVVIAVLGKSIALTVKVEERESAEIIKKSLASLENDLTAIGWSPAVMQVDWTNANEGG